MIDVDGRSVQLILYYLQELHCIFNYTQCGENMVIYEKSFVLNIT